MQPTLAGFARLDKLAACFRVEVPAQSLIGLQAVMPRWRLAPGRPGASCRCVALALAAAESPQLEQ